MTYNTGQMEIHEEAGKTFHGKLNMPYDPNSPAGFYESTATKAIYYFFDEYNFIHFGGCLFHRVMGIHSMKFPVTTSQFYRKIDIQNIVLF